MNQHLASYAPLVQLFIELRGKGLSLSGDEMLMLEKWANLNLKPDFLAKIMLETADEMVNSKTAFPLTLHFLDRRINALKRRKAEF